MIGGHRGSAPVPYATLVRSRPGRRWRGQEADAGLAGEPEESLALGSVADHGNLIGDEGAQARPAMGYAAHIEIGAFEYAVDGDGDIDLFGLDIAGKDKKDKTVYLFKINVRNVKDKEFTELQDAIDYANDWADYEGDYPLEYEAPWVIRTFPFRRRK